MRAFIVYALLLIPAAAPVAGAQRTFRTVGEDFRNALASEKPPAVCSACSLYQGTF